MTKLMGEGNVTAGYAYRAKGIGSGVGVETPGALVAPWNISYTAKPTSRLGKEHNQVRSVLLAQLIYAAIGAKGA